MKLIIKSKFYLICLLLIFSTLSIVLEENQGMISKDSNDQSIIFKENFFMNPGDHFKLINFGWSIRTYRIHIPSNYDGLTPVPLVLVFHGNTGNSLIIKNKTNFDEKSDEDGFITVYPNGRTDIFTRLYFKIFHNRKAGSWNGGFCCGSVVKMNVDDIGFINSLIKHLQNKLNIDSSRIYATGNSNGGILSYRLGAELTDIFAAIGVSGGSIGGRLNKFSEFWINPEPKHELPVIIIHGMKDEVVPYDGNLRFLSVNTSVSFWVQNNKCNPIPTINISKSKNVIKKTYSNGDNQSDVILYSVVNGTHSWYGSESSPISEISTTELIWEFFKCHTKD